MKYLLFFCCFFSLVCCGNDEESTACLNPTLRGRLAVQGICLNYVIQVVAGEIDPELVEAEWTHEFTGETFTRVFRLGNPCNFPENLQEADTFDFVLIPEPLEPSCAVCEAFSPTPEKYLNIRVCR